MNSAFYPKLAWMNIKKNKETYLPFMVTCILTVAMFYIMDALSINKGLDNMVGAESLKVILDLGTKVIGIFSVIFLFYTNSFLIKRRKKEIGLYNVLGLEKKHIANVLFFEFIYTSIFTLVVGLGLGIILNKLMFLLLLKIIKFRVSFGFDLALPAIIKTLIIFTVIFLLNLLSNLIQIKILKPIELLKGSEHGEREPKTKWIMTLIGIIALASGYTLALRVKSPLTALTMFFVAVILVMIGTYALFTAGSIAVLKLLRKNKNFYYKTDNFISISGMMYRMKQNAVGLANICILSTCVLVMISSTVSLYAGMNDVIKTRHPRAVEASFSNVTNKEAQKIENIFDDVSKNSGIKVENKLSYVANTYPTELENGYIKLLQWENVKRDVTVLNLIPISNYNEVTGKNIKLQDNEIIIYSNVKGYNKGNLKIGDKTFKIKEELNKPVTELRSGFGDVMESHMVFINNIDSLGVQGRKEYSIGVDVKGSDKDINTLSDKLKDKFEGMNKDIYVESSVSSKQDFLMIYGGLFFLGIFLGMLFLMATVLIIYYKQMSEGYDDKKRFEIMQKVGMGKSEIKKTIKRQILMVFFLPFVAAVIHIGFAFPMITKLLAVLNLRNTNIFMISTIGTILVFGVIYGIVFSLTARAYYKIVK